MGVLNSSNDLLYSLVRRAPVLAGRLRAFGRDRLALLA